MSPLATERGAVRRLLAGICAMAVLMSAAIGLSGPLRAEVLSFEDLDGWQQDGQAEALRTFLDSCGKLKGPGWGPLCKLAGDVPGDDASARAFFEIFFKPVLVGNPPALFTGYYEPELRGSPVRTGRFQWPLYRRPPDLADGRAYFSRASIEAGAISGRGLELAWIDDPVEVFFLHIQGSGRVKMPDGSVVRLGYAGKNGHPYRSIGQEMIRRGLLTADQASAGSIANFVRRNPAFGAELLNHNPSYVFFRKLPDLAADKGPIGAMGLSITPMRSVAIDPRFTPLGAPVWIEKQGRVPLRRLMVAQDTGGAIKGAQRADIFYGYGHEAGAAAGIVKDGGRMVLLLPIEQAWAMAGEG